MSKQLDLPVIRMLLSDWFARVAREAGLPLKEQYGSSGQAFTIGAPKRSTTFGPADFTKDLDRAIEELQDFKHRSTFAASCLQISPKARSLDTFHHRVLALLVIRISLDFRLCKTNQQQAIR